MERKLYESIVGGNVSSFTGLVQEDPLILDRFMVAFVSKSTPLHIAVMLGHIDIAKELLKLKPDLASEPDARGSTPLHLASARGYLGIVEKLLSIDSYTRLDRDQNGRTPLHVAVIQGQDDVLIKLLEVRSMATMVMLDQGETILHLCVRHKRVNALKLLVDSMGDHNNMLVNSKDNLGSTILHLAVSYKQIETVEYLLSNIGVELNVLNINGFTALDLLPSSSPRDSVDSRIRTVLQQAGASRAKDTFRLVRRNQVPDTQVENGIEKKQNALMVVASLIATMAFQVIVNPPGGIWQDDVPSSDSESRRGHVAGFAIAADNYPGGYHKYLIVNTIGFIASLSIILLLICGLPLRNKLFMWILTLIMWIAITSMAVMYVALTTALTPSHVRGRVFISYLTFALWLGLIFLIFLGHTFRLVFKWRRKVGLLTKESA